MNRVIFFGRIHFKNKRSVNLAKAAYIRFDETIAKGDMMYRPEALFGDEEQIQEEFTDLFLDFPRTSHAEVTDKNIAHTTKAMESLLGYAMAGRIDMFVITAGELPRQITRVVDNAKSAAQYFGEGQEALEAGAYDEAIAEFTSSIRSFPRHPWAYDARALARFELDQYDEAEADFREARTQYPALPSPHLGLAKIFAQREAYSAAMDACKEAMRHSIPHQAGYWITALFSAEVMMARLEKEMGKLSDAEVDLYHKQIDSYLDRYRMKLKQLGSDRTEHYPTPEHWEGLMARFEGLKAVA